MIQAAEVVSYAAGIPDGKGLRDVVLALVGTLAFIVLACRALAAFADEKYGKLVTLVIGAVIVLGFAYFPDQSIDIIKGLWTTFVGVRER